MILYHATGTAFLLTPELWQHALRQARAHGWQPAGTLPPPTPLDSAPSPWHAAYEPAAGQQVSRPDARALASALDCACGDSDDPGLPLRQLAHFCRSGGFLVSSSPDLDNLVSLARLTAATAAADAPFRHAQAHPAESKAV